MFVKIKNTTLIKFPYTYADLREENPHTKYDKRYTLPEWYAMTDEGLTSGNQVIEIRVAEQPEYNTATHYLGQKAEPELLDGEWVWGWNIIERSSDIEDEE